MRTSPVRQEGQEPIHFDCLDGLRGLAFLLVFGFHWWQTLVLPVQGGLSPGLAGTLACVMGAGRFGVEMFFVLSAYLITRLLLLEEARFGGIRPGLFWIRRGLRIWPLYQLSIQVPFLLAALRGYRGLGGMWASFSAGLPNLWIGAHGWPVNQLIVLIPHWSIGIEEQFYLCFPLLVLAVKPRRLPWLCAAMILVAVAFRGWWSLSPPAHPYLYCHLATRLDNFALGIGLGWWHHRHGMGGRLAPRYVSLGVAIGLLLMASGPAGSLAGSRFINLGYPAASIAALFFLDAAWAFPFLRTPAWRWLGSISFPAYLFQQGVLTALRLASLRFRVPPIATALAGGAAAFGITLGVAYLAHRLVEAPFNTFKRRFARV